MIQWNQFEQIVVQNLKRDITEDKNPDQNKAISAPIDQSQFIVAGPGSGKTTVMVLKILKFIYVDNIHPSNILATTFTRKAAAELRSRILSWGDQIRQHLIQNPTYSSIHNDLKRLDFNQIITGTLDSISEDILRNHRDPGAAPPIVVEDFVANAIMMRVGLFSQERHHEEDLREYLIELRGGKFGFNTSEMSKSLLEIKDRFYHDQVDFYAFKDQNDHPGCKLACDAIADYIDELKDKLLFDFAMLEQEFLNKLQDGKLDKFLKDIKLILVDEYQDTNLLQEKIYFYLAKAAIENKGSIIVVGDDDQSLYRFRGATVDLFTNFKERIQNELKISPDLINLSKNYRSTGCVVDLCNYFALLDSKFQPARVEGKPKIVPARFGDFTDFPILGMFRRDIHTLADDLAKFIHKVIYEDGFKLEYNGRVYKIQADQKEGSPTDISLLLSSPREMSFGGKPRLPLRLREKLMEVNPEIHVFNPRGQSLERIHWVSVLCGLILECIDPYSNVQDNIEKMPRSAKYRFDKWRQTAQKYVEENPEPNDPVTLKQFTDAWKTRTPLGRKSWKRDVPLMGLVYKLVTWIPVLQDDVEGLVYLEAVTRTIAQTGFFSSYGSEIVFDEKYPDLEWYSIKEAYWNIFVPIATGAIDVDEDLLETLPDDRISFMSIHQAKGLEFPLTIVDVGSDFRQSYPAQAFKRFPEDGGKSCALEDELRLYCPLGAPDREGRDRAFDDLIRQYFVAFSRAQDVLLLIGLNSVLDGYRLKYGEHRLIPNVATGWDRDGNNRGLKDLIRI
ncbi:MAG: ATP-dependent helicase [Methanobacterium sp.]|jgi:DNA helicase-2/ATP-dependent DNA helicase PcrA